MKKREDINWVTKFYTYAFLCIIRISCGQAFLYFLKSELKIGYFTDEYLWIPLLIASLVAVYDLAVFNNINTKASKVDDIDEKLKIYAKDTFQIVTVTSSVFVLLMIPFLLTLNIGVILSVFLFGTLINFSFIPSVKKIKRSLEIEEKLPEYVMKHRF